MFMNQIIKPIRKEDKKRILEIASKTWDGDDYLSYIIDDWLSDTKGFFLGLWIEKKLIGFGRMIYITPEYVWLEGLRKDQESDIKGVGEMLARKFLSIIKKDRNIKLARFTTYYDNIQSIKLNEKLGFKKIHTFSLKSFELNNDIQEFIIREIDNMMDFEEVFQYIKDSEYLSKMKNFISRGWKIHSFTENLIRKFYKEDKIFCLKEKDEIKGVLIFDQVDYKDVLWISFIDAKSELFYKKLLDFAKILAPKYKKNEIQVLVPDLSNLLSSCKKTGYESWERENDFLLYELSLV